MKLRRIDVFRHPATVLIEDATGAGRPCRMILARDALRKYPCELPRDVRRIIYRRVYLAVAAPWLICAAAYVAVILTIVYWVDLSRASGLVTLALLLGVLMTVYFTIGAAPMRMAYRRAHVDFFTQARRCSWCLYDLAGAPEDGEGLTRCPECGGAWRLPPTASDAPHPPPRRAG